ncbi:Gx transporter family protein [Arabiibacter massiliensis]|uniref:Gx transporter family protein n=1 Tax=Arabiibacter massiliensis TaxID=1870985 RepID=UPI0009B939D4|nr:Gx transporter family protein [Arabiibacter massiliensis]
MASTPSRAERRAALRVSRCALLAALALAIAALESMLPIPAPVPGMKLGLSNIVTILAAFWLGPVEAVIVFLVRVVLAAALTGQLAALPFSLAGGALALAVTLAFARLAPPAYIRLCSMAAAVAHNAGQIGVAVLLTATPEIALYLPILMVAGLATGFVTGTVADAVFARLPMGVTKGRRDEGTGILSRSPKR